MKQFLVLLVLLMPASLWSQIINIPDDYSTIQQGIENASHGDTVLVSPGTYFENIDFIGKNITVASNFILTNDTSFISQTLINGSNLGRVVQFSNNEDSTASLVGLTITNGIGGIYSGNASPTLSYLKISNNTCENGGAILLYNSNSRIINVIISENYSTGTGGGIYLERSDLYIENSSILNNSSDDGGGGIYCNKSLLSIINVNIINNISPKSGGGISTIFDCEIEILNSKIIGNSASSGGGIHGYNIILENVWIEQNIARGDGGGIHGSNFNLENVTITNNSASRGGGIYGTNLRFDSINRSSIYLNQAVLTKDIYTGDSIYLFLDTCTVLKPTEFHCEPISLITFDILYGLIEQTEQDLYISPFGNNNNSGLSKDEPLKTIDFALTKNLADSNNQQIIYLENGTYSREANEEFFPINLPDYIDIIGESKEGVILNGNNEVDRIIGIYWNNNNSISNLTVRGAKSGASDHSGYGIYSYGSITNLTNLLVTENYGIGISLQTDNTAIDTLVLDNLEITKNKNSGVDLAIGSYVKFSNSIISENGYQDGGGIDCSGYGQFENLVISGNKVSNYGGGIRGGGYVTMINVVVENNTAWLGGGISLSSGKIENIQILNNTADLGGGVYMNGGHPLSINNVLFAGNNAERGGAFYTREKQGDISFNNSTIVNNTADFGGGICIYGEYDRLIRITNSILWYNYANEIYLGGNGSTTLTFTRSDIYGGQSQIVNESNGQVIWFEGNITENPNFVNSGDNPYNLTTDSPCIDTGRPDTIGLNLPPGDLIGNKRIWDGNNDGSEIIDMGAYEYGSIPLSVNEKALTSSIVNVYPNPFSSFTSIEYQLDQPSEVILTIFNHLGEQVDLVRQQQSSGKQRVNWNAEGLAPGMYFFTLKADGQVATGKMVLMR